MQDLQFYQSIDLPDGHHAGSWDHRGSTDVYLGHTAFAGKTVLDVGPANGFWSFEMERRGAEVTALELGPDDKWDGVPHGGRTPEGLDDDAVEKVARVFRTLVYSKEQLGSKLVIVRGTAYDAPKLVQPVDIALMGNILQHLRDPFLAIERVSSVVKERIIISETLWIDDLAFLESASMRLIPRKETPQVTHSWYQVSPPWVGEVLSILGFGNFRCEYHDQQFVQTPTDKNSRMVRHFTYSADRL